jgi:hypothetical protein
MVSSSAVEVGKRPNLAGRAQVAPSLAGAWQAKAPRGALGATGAASRGRCGRIDRPFVDESLMSDRSAIASARRRLVPLFLFASCIAMLAGCGGGGAGGGTVASGPQVAPAPGVDGPAWPGFARDAQHTALGAIATQDLNRVSWSTPLDLAPPYRADGTLLVHYGSPVVTSHNTVVVPVKTGASDGFRLDAFDGFTGASRWTLTTDYTLPPHDWTPSYSPTIAPGNTLYYAGAGGTIYKNSNLDSGSPSARTQLAFFGANNNAGDL